MVSVCYLGSSVFEPRKTLVSSPALFFFTYHCRNQEATCGLPIRLPQLFEVSSSSDACAPSSVTIYLPTLFLLHLLDLAYCLAPWYSNDSPFSIINSMHPLYSVLSPIPIMCYDTILAHYDIYLLLSNQDMIYIMNFLGLQLTSPWVLYCINDVVGLG